LRPHREKKEKKGKDLTATWRDREIRPRRPLARRRPRGGREWKKKKKKKKRKRNGKRAKK